MRAEFAEFYRPGDGELKGLVGEGTIVLDTNVLLDAYRLPSEGREGLIALIDQLKERIWIPHQVALEFQKNRVGVIAEQRKKYDEIIKNWPTALATLEAEIKLLEIDKHQIGIKESALLKTLNMFREDLATAMEKLKESLPQLSLVDPIRDRLDTILADRVGASYATQSAIDDIYKSGAHRYQHQHPPGFQDKDKSDTYMHSGITYQKRYGDLLLWRQILDHVSAGQTKKVLFVTSDTKDDWWSSRSGRTLGPHPDLISEIHGAGAELFWMYTLPQFLTFANEHLRAGISQTTVKQVEEVVAGYVHQDVKKWNNFRFHSPEDFYPRDAAEGAVAVYLARDGYRVLPPIQRTFAFMVSRGNELHGVTILKLQFADSVDEYRAVLYRELGKLSTAHQLWRNLLGWPGILVILQPRGMPNSGEMREDAVSVISSFHSSGDRFQEIHYGTLDDVGMYLPLNIIGDVRAGRG